MVKFRPIRLEIPKRLLKKFEDAAKAAWPKETFAYLIGDDAGTNVGVVDVFIPHGVEKFCDKVSVTVQPEWYAEAVMYARELKAHVIGDIHSHTMEKNEAGMTLTQFSAPSSLDLANWGPTLAGITAVRQLKNKNFRAKTQFWGPMVPVRVVLKNE